MKKRKILKTAAAILVLLILVILIVVFYLVKDGFQTIETRPYEAAETKYSSWDEVLTKAATVKVKTLQSGTLKMDRALLLDRENSKTPDVENRYDPFPVMYHWIRHKTVGDILIDAGYDSTIVKNPPYGNDTAVMKLVMWRNGDKIYMEPGGDAASQVKVNNIQPKKVFFTHLHTDHSMGAKELPNDIEYIFNRADIDFNMKAVIGDTFKNKRNVKTFDFSQGKSIPPFSRVIDLLGDGSLWAVSTPGQSTGHTSYLAITKKGPVLLIGDAAHFIWSYENNVAPEPWTEEVREPARKSLNELRAFAKKYPGMEIRFSHDSILSYLPQRTREK
ncbi:MAG: MBL fold metallo-hydrolase [bacterium]|nr:MBL fold metallo-hydrolase [bacterium]